MAKLSINLDNIPKLPSSTMNLINLVFDDEVDIDELVKLISQDVSLSAEVMKMANSPIYRTTEAVESLSRAVVNLGLDTIKKIVLSIVVIDSMRDLLPPESINTLLTHALVTATAGQIIAEKTGLVKSEEAFLNGLFLNLGVFVCASMWPRAFHKCYQEAHEQGIQLDLMIGEKFQVKPLELSRQVAIKWGLPSRIIDTIVGVYNMQCLGQDKQVRQESSIVVVSYLANLAADVYIGISTTVSIEKFRSQFVSFSQQGSDMATDILDVLSQEFNQFTEVLSLELPTQPTYTDILKKANQELLKINDKHEQMYRALASKNRELINLTREIEKKNQILNKLVTTDPLTSLYNRRYFEKHLERCMYEASRYDRPLSIVMLDIDFFKKINDNEGHKAGDEVLKHVSKILRETTRQSDICARYGGEEFIIVLPEIAWSTAYKVAEKLRRSIESLQIDIVNSNLENKTVSVTASFGVAALNENIKTPSELIVVCDKYLYQSKTSGRNCISPIIEEV